MKVSLKDNELIYKEFVIHSGDEWIKDNIYIIGPDTIVWNGSAEYYLNNKEDAEFVPTFPSKVKGTYKTTNNSITISIKDKYSGTIKLIIMTGTDIYTKEIRIVSV